MVIRDYDDIIASAIRSIFSKDNPYAPNLSPNRYPYYSGVKSSSPFDEMVTTPDRFVFAGCYFNEEVAFVPWVDNNISAHRIHMDDYSVSFGFGGCYMAKYLYKNCCYISHIHCDSNSSGSDCKGIWNNFYMQYENDLRVLALFQPTDLHDRIYKKMVQYNTNYYTSNGNENGILTNIAGVITPDNRCYSVLVNNLNHTPLMIDCKCGNNITIPQNIETNCCLII